jgi:hypothetical protein
LKIGRFSVWATVDVFQLLAAWREIRMLIIYGLRCLLSSVLVTGAIFFVVYGITETRPRIPLPNALSAFLLIISIAFLGYFESGQVAVVNLSVIDPKQSKSIATNLPLTYRVYQTISQPGVVEKYLIGRQLCVIGLVFFISQLTSFPHMPQILPYGLEHLLIKTGLPGVLITLTIGQLFPQLLADEYTLRFLNLKGSLLFINIAMLIETFGVFTHFSWLMSYGLIAWVFHWTDRRTESGHATSTTYNPIDSIDLSQSAHNLLWGPKTPVPSSTHAPSPSSDPLRAQEQGQGQGQGSVEMMSPTGETICREEIEQLNPYKSGFFHSLGTLLLFTASTLLTLLSMFFIVYGLAFNRPVLSAPRPVLFLLFFLCTLAEFYLEGAQVAVLAIQHLETVGGDTETGAVRIHRLVNSSSDGVKRFLVGRQFLIVLSMFTMASLTSFTDYSQPFLPAALVSPLALSGFFGVIFGLNTVQLPGQMIAKQYPVSFLSLPGMELVVRAALVAESTGLMHFGWVLFHSLKHLVIAEN